MQTSPRSSYEKTVIGIMRRLPPERLTHLVEFARFLEFETKISQVEDEAVKEKPLLAGDKKWDELLAKPEAKALLRKMAREARAEYLAGETTKIQITDDDRLAPA